MPTTKPRISVVLTEEEHKAIKALAKRERRTMSNIVSLLIAKALDGMTIPENEEQSDG